MGMGTGAPGDLEPAVVSVCCLSLLGLTLNGCLLDVNSVVVTIRQHGQL